MNKVCVMLSTYNGIQYLEELIESIEKQKGVYVELIIRDDGSVDETQTYLKKCAQKYNNIELFLEKNVGVIQSYKELIKKAGHSKADYFAFADQDDVWLEKYRYVV